MASRLILILFLSLALHSCTKKCVNPDTNIHVLIEDGNSQWFRGVAGKQTMKARSVLGLTESYNIALVNREFTLEEKNCDRILGETRLLLYSSSLYKHHFYFKIQREKERSVITITGDNYPVFHNHLSYDIGQSSFCEVFYYHPQSYKTTKVTVPIVTLDSLSISGNAYTNVYRIDFDTAYSLEPGTKAIYFTAKDGLLKFDEFNGDSWELY